MSLLMVFLQIVEVGYVAGVSQSIKVYYVTVRSDLKSMSDKVGANKSGSACYENM